MSSVELAQVDLNLLVVLSVLLEEASLTRAGRRLGRTPSALSHSLGRLRELLGDPLLVRVGHQLVPTPAAEALREPLARCLTGVTELLRAGPVDPARLRRRFRIIASDYLQRVLLPPLLGRLRAAAPGVDVQVLPVPSSLPEVLAAEGGADLAFGVSFSAPEGLRSRGLGVDRFVSVARRESWTCGEDPAAFADLPHVLVAPAGLPGGPVDRALAERGLRRRLVVTLPSFFAAVELVAATDLVVTMPERLARLLAPPELMLRPPPVTLEPYRLLALWHPRVHADPANRWLRELLGEAPPLPAPDAPAQGGA